MFLKFPEFNGKAFFSLDYVQSAVLDLLEIKFISQEEGIFLGKGKIEQAGPLEEGIFQG